jgi:peptide/nickel transport system permease protein
VSASAEAAPAPSPTVAKPKEQHPIRTLVVRRLLLGVVTVVLIAILVYAATIVLPGDAATSILGNGATPQRLAQVRSELGLDQPVLTRFADWATNAVQGDFGTSLTPSAPSATSLVLPRLANSAVLLFVSALFASLIGVLLGIYAALHRDGKFDTVASVIGLAAAALPEFVIAIFVVMLFSVNVFQVFPAVSILPPGSHIWDEPNKLVLPALALIIVTAPYVFRMMRGAMIESLSSDYVEMARLKGVGERRLALRHALPNALPPVIQVIGLVVLYLAGGIVLVEVVFNFPGIGSQLVEAVGSRDVPVIQFTVILLAIFYVVLNIATDVIVLLVTPRKRYPR